MLEIGSLVDGKYKILNEVGHGGMSVVYLAMNEKANKQWAVKEVRKDGIKDLQVVIQGLVAETDILKKLNHPNLPSIIDVIDTDDSFIIIMDYIQGNSLQKALDEYGAQPQEYVISWAKQLCDVLGYLHTRNPAIIYRDMKPGNIMLKPDGNVTLIDFGTAREFKDKKLEDTTCLGTIGYAAPEQFGGQGQTDARTDIYCLGATLYHLVTGMNPCEPPYDIRPIREINPALSGGLERIIQKCTQKNPELRYQSAAELMYALEHYEEIDDLYKKKQKNKLSKFITCASLTMVFAATSVFGYVSAENQKRANYDAQLNVADSIQEYYDTIMIDPQRTEAYLGNQENEGLLQFLIEDGVLTNEENSALTKLKYSLEQVSGLLATTKPVEVLKILERDNYDGYVDVCYNIGELYWAYYNVGVEKDKYAAAAAWYSYAKDNEKYVDAKIRCEISASLNDIEKSKKEGQSKKLAENYKQLWQKLNELHSYVVSLEDADLEALNKYKEDLQIPAWSAIISLIYNNVSDLSVVLEKDEILALVDSIETECQKIDMMFGDDIQNLLDMIATTKLKVNSVKNTDTKE